MDKDFKMVKSVYGSNLDVITNIMALYNIEQFDLDCTYSKGNFWKDLPHPVNKTDLYPHYDHVIEANSENLPFGDSTIHRSLLLVVVRDIERIKPVVPSSPRDLKVMGPTTTSSQIITTLLKNSIELLRRVDLW
jgi:hypothetical protein